MKMFFSLPQCNSEKLNILTAACTVINHLVDTSFIGAYNSITCSEIGGGGCYSL